ncbi:Krueppel-like factor 17 [Erinaceus europaeus]|uniref:Krueppel-like factor 17 n=1 Tax=Erinaceus europaeus TaxID=9365 RepID=A0A1S3A8J7_ERIEU|nr:Krueppel-like factor 17 [Erinaceus europaeus]
MSDMSLSPSSNYMYTSWNSDPSGMQDLHQHTEQERIPLVSIKAHRQNINEMGPQLSESPSEYAMNYCPQRTLTPQMMYHQRTPPSEPGMVFNEHPTMPLEFSNPELAMPYWGSLRTPTSRPLVSALSGIPMMSHSRAPTMHYLDYLTSNRDSTTYQMFSASNMPFEETQVMLPGTNQVFPTSNPDYSGMLPAESPSLLALGSYSDYLSQPVFQEYSFLPGQPRPASQSGEQASAERRDSPPLRPYSCHYENCGKAYTKKSHLVSHLRKHTGERPYKCNWKGCLWSFMRSDELGRHMRIHNKNRPYKCHCGREFTRSDHLRQHEKTHLRELLSLHPHLADLPGLGL